MSIIFKFKLNFVLVIEHTVFSVGLYNKSKPSSRNIVMFICIPVVGRCWCKTLWDTRVAVSLDFSWIRPLTFGPAHMPNYRPNCNATVAPPTCHQPISC